MSKWTDFRDKLIKKILAAIGWYDCLPFEGEEPPAGETNLTPTTEENSVVSKMEQVGGSAAGDLSLASCWFGSSAGTRIMNILSPKLSESQFQDRFDKSAARGVNTFHLFLVNKGDGEGAGYRVTDKATADVADQRIRYIHERGYSVVLWCMADDSSAWSKNFDMAALMAVCRDRGWLNLVDEIVVGLEVDEYWDKSTVKSHIKTIREYFKGPVGVHGTSGKTEMYGADTLYYQTEPGKTAAQIKTEVVKVVKAVGKPVVAFELSRREDRKLCEAAIEGGAVGVGNW